MLALAALALLGASGAADAGAQSAPPRSQSAAVVRVPFPQEDGSLTPYTFELGYSLVTLVYDTLLWRDAAGTPKPWLAESVTTSSDGLQVTLRLAGGARWHDGVPVTAADVAFTFDYVATHPHPRFTPQLRAVLKVDAPDLATAVITLRHPAAGFADQPLADLPILPAHLWRDLPPSRQAPDGLPVGSGPYRLVEHRPGELYRLAADPGYFKGPPAVETLEVPIVPDAEAAFRLLEHRRADAIAVNLPDQAASRLRGLGIRVVSGPGYLGTQLVLNLRRAPFDRPEARRAVARAIDVERVARTVANAVPADRGYVHPSSPWAPASAVSTFDATAARAELARLALPPIEVLAPDSDPVKSEAARQVALAIERAGAVATARPVPLQELSRVLGEDGAEATFTAAITASPALVSYDPDGLRWLFGTSPEEASLNDSGYRSISFDTLADRVATTVERSARQVAVTETLQLLATDVPALPLFFSNGTFAFRPSVYDGWAFVKGTGIIDKRSFVGPRETSGAEAPAPPGAGGMGVSFLGYLAAALVGGAIVATTVAVVRGRH